MKSKEKKNTSKMEVIDYRNFFAPKDGTITENMGETETLSGKRSTSLDGQK